MPLATYGDYEIEATMRDEYNHILITCEDDRDNYSVYERLPPNLDDGHRDAKWLADFGDKADAIMFTLLKGTPA